MSELVIKKGELITALLYAKKTLVHEDFISKDEYNYYIENILYELNSRDINIKLNNRLSKEDFIKEHGLIKPNSPIRDLIIKYKKNPALYFLYDKFFQNKLLQGYYKSKLDRIDTVLNEENNKQVLSLKV